MKKKKEISATIEAIDVHNDNLLIDLGIRLPNYIRPVFNKTRKEKELLKKLRTKHDKFYSVKNKNSKQIPCYGKLIVYTKRKVHSTCSYKCYQYEISDVLKTMHPENDVIKYWWNGYTYFPSYTPSGNVIYDLSIRQK